MSDSTLLHKKWYAWIGRRVCLSTGDTGILKYFGEIKSKDGFWCGVELDEPIGKTDGIIHKIQYFKCKANHGIFVPMDEVTRIKSRSIDLNRLSDLSKFKCNEDELGDEANKKTQTKNLCSKLDKMSGMNENRNIPDTLCHKNSQMENKHTDFVDKKYVNVCKRSKNSCSRFGTEESLGILSNLLDEDGSWNLLDHSNATSEKSLIQKISDESEGDSVFSPQVKPFLPSSKFIYARHIDNPIRNFNIKCTSTPKNCLDNIFDLGATVNLDHNQSYDLLYDEIEPIIAGSSGPKLMDFDLTKFKHNEILCSTSKLTIPLLPSESLLLDKVPCIKDEELGNSDRNKDHIFKAENRNNVVNTTQTIPNECLNKYQFSNTRGIPESLGVLNATYEINPESLKYPNVKEASQNLGFESNAFNSDRKANAVIHFNSTFVLPIDHSVKESEADKTFVIERSPVKPIERTLSTELEINFEKKSLSIIFEKTSNENLSNIDAGHSTSISSLKPDSNRTLISSKHSPESIDKMVKSLNSSSKIGDKEQITSDLNSTFCINSEKGNGKRNTAYQDVNKRYSLSSIAGENNLPIHKEKSNIVTRKSIKLPQSFSTQKKAFDSHATSTSSTIKAKVIKNPTVGTVAKKKAEVEDKNASKDSSLKLLSKLSSKDSLKNKCSSSIANVTEHIRKTVDSCKALCKQTGQKDNASHVALKITGKNTQISARRKSVGGLETKAISKISYTYNKIGISEHPNVNRKLNNGTDSFGFNSKNLTDAKHSKIKRRHTMLPTDVSNGNQAKSSLSKCKSDLSNGTSCVAKPTNAFTNNICVKSSKALQNGFGDKKENTRESTVEKSAPVEEILENESKDCTKFGIKKIENVAAPKRELLKPGTLSRLPVPEKSIKKPGFISGVVEPQHSIKNINQVDKQRMYKRLPLRKLQDQSS